MCWVILRSRVRASLTPSFFWFYVFIPLQLWTLKFFVLCWGREFEPLSPQVFFLVLCFYTLATLNPEVFCFMFLLPLTWMWLGDHWSLPVGLWEEIIVISCAWHDVTPGRPAELWAEDSFLACFDYYQGKLGKLMRGGHCPEDSTPSPCESAAASTRHLAFLRTCRWCATALRSPSLPCTWTWLRTGGK
jgi:hypothetical protein